MESETDGNLTTGQARTRVAMITVTCNMVPDSLANRGSAWCASANVGGINYSATSRSSAVGALCRELVAGDVPDDELRITFDNVRGFMHSRSFHKLAGATLSEGNEPISRVKWAPYSGPQNAQRAVAGEVGIGEPTVRAHPEPSEENASVASPKLSVTRACEACGDPVTAKRSDAKFCSGRCRIAAYRRIAA